MAEIKFVSAERLGYYDQLIKKYIKDADTAVNDALQAKIDAANAAITAEETARKAADATLNSDIETAQAAADKAQGEVDVLEAYVGTIPEAAEATNIVAYVQEKTAGIATDTALEELAGRVTQAEADIDAIEKDYLVEADKTELNGLITAAQEAADKAQGEVDALEQTHANDKAALEAEDARIVGLVTAEAEARAEADEAIDARLVEVEAFFKLAEDEQLDTALDTLVEIQNFVNNEGAAADQMVLDIAANKKAIEDEATARANADSALSGRLDTLEAIDHDAYVAADTALKTELNTEIAKKADATDVASSVEALEAADESQVERIAALEAKFTGDSSVDNQIATAKQEAVDAAAADATSKANAAESNAKSYADGLDSAMDARMDVVEAKAHEHSNKALLDTYTQTETDLADAVAKKHEHSNLAVLEGITSAKVTAWDAAEQNAKSYADGLNTAMDTRVATLEDWHENFEECTEADIDALFTA